MTEVVTGRSARPVSDAALVRRVRWRLLAWSGGTTLVVLTLLGVLLYWAVASSLASAGEEQLRTRARELAPGIGFSVAAPVPGPFDVVVDSGAYPGMVIGGPTSGTFAYVVGPGVDPIAGRSGGASVTGGGVRSPLLIQTLSLPEGAGLAAARDGKETITTTEIDGTPVRVLSTPIEAPVGTLVVQVVGDRTAELRTLTVLLLVLAIGGLLVLAASLVVGWLYADRALVPIRDALRRQREFAADASHELRTPLAVVRGSLEDLRRNADQPVAEVGTALDDIESEMDRLNALVDDLLLLARTDSGAIELALEPTDLGEIALDAAGSLVATAARRDVTIEVDAEPVPMTGDQARLRQLVTILLDNAVRHAPDGSTVAVGVHADGPTARIVVDDRGPGFAPADLPRVFDRFWRAPDAPEGGTGLGLSIAAWIAERHGGRISASNRPDGGARVEVDLPTR